jgi:surfactin family lipopeptide synthetase A
MIPATFAQQRLWFLDQLAPQSAVYNIPACLRISTTLDVETLEQSLHALVQRHEILRTTFAAVDGHPMQVIAPSLTLPLPTIDLSALPMAEREAEALRLANDEVRRPFDLIQGPLLRMLLLRLGAEEHLLVLTMHHTISDGWSINLLFQELATLYTAFASGAPSPLPDLPIQYADFALWQQEQLQEEALADQLTYWKQKLADAPSVLDLPTDHLHPAVPTSRGSVYFVTLPSSLAEALKALSRKENVTLYMTLVAAFQTLLYRYTRQDDMVLGAFMAGRRHADLETLIGFFVNTLVLRTDLSGNPTFCELLGRVREVTLEADAHQELPFESLVKELRPTRSLGQNPLFQVILALDPPLPTLPAGWELSKMVVETGTAKFNLSLEIAEWPDGLGCRFEYSTDLFDEPTIARMAGHWQTLLEGIVADPTRRISELPLLTEQEQQQLLVAWNATQATYPTDACLHQLFEAQVERTPEAVAVVFEDEQLSYRELNRRANQLARHLQQLGVEPEALVGLCVERSLDMLVGLLGILKAGGAYVPLDPAFPVERLAFMLQDSQASVLVTQQHLLPQLPTRGTKVVCLDADAAVLAQYSEATPPCGVTSAQLAYVIYTSGSTGKPKGVQILHRAVVNFLLSMRQQPGLTAADRWLAITTLSFDIAALELFLPLIVGARVIVASREMAADGAALAEALRRGGVTVMQATPVTWRLLLATGWPGQPTLKVLCGGEALPLDLAQQLLPRVGSLWNVYGPTETTIWSTLCQITPDQEVISIGRPIANTQIYLLDEHLQPVPVGVPGELFIGGDGLARGYLKRPELTVERFLPHPFSDEPAARLYRTGDLARYRSDGTIEHLGRLDFQVKLRGFRIELGEIEAVLVQHPGVRQAVVVVREDQRGDKRLVAYLLTSGQSVPASSELRSFVQKQLPDYMLPSAFVCLEALPLTPNGKVDRRALPAPELTKRTAEETFVVPTLQVHYQLISIWEELLDVRPIGIKDDFFDLGGHSFLAARMIHRIEQVFGKKIPFVTLFAEPTIEHLANALVGEEDVGSRVPLGEEDSGSRVPVVAVQAGGSKTPFFFLHGQYESDTFYCYPLARSLGSDQPFYALERYSFDGLAVPPSLEAMATAHLKALRAIQPEGPYLLGGWCNGGLISYEMARQLHAEGQRVDLLVLIDPDQLVYPANLRLLHTLISRVGDLLGLGRDKQLDWFVRLRRTYRYGFLPLRHVYRYLRHAYRYLRYSSYRKLKDSERVSYFDIKKYTEPLLGTTEKSAPGYRPDETDATFPRVDWENLRRDYLDMYNWVALGYRPPDLYPGKITFFWTSGEPYRRGWRKVEEANEVEVHILPGEHMDTLTKHLDALAERLRTSLRELTEIT